MSDRWTVDAEYAKSDDREKAVDLFLDYCDISESDFEGIFLVMDRLIGSIQQLEDNSDKYFELLHAVENKFPNETRHETALRYIQQAEKISEGPTKEEPSDG